MLVLRNDVEDQDPEQVEKRFSNNSDSIYILSKSLVFQDQNEMFLARLISNSEGSHKDSEEQGIFDRSEI